MAPAHIDKTLPAQSIQRRGSNTLRRSGHDITNVDHTTNNAMDKRKSIVFMAAEAVQQERDTIRALKRLSMGGGGSLALDPDLSFGIEHELETTVHGGDSNGVEDDPFPSVSRRKRSSSSSSLVSETSYLDDDEDGDLTLVDRSNNDSDIDDNNNNNNNSSNNSSTENDEDIKMDTEKLLWVPAKSHPGIAPDQFKRHVQNTLQDMNKKITSTSTKRSYSLPSLKELTDELDKLSEMAGLEANDAITLARSLSSASSSSHLLLSKEKMLLKRDDKDSIRRDSSTNSNEGSDSESSMDEDSPLFTSTNSLKRNKWSTYSRSRRGTNKDKPPRLNSPLNKNFEDDNQTPPEPITKDKQDLESKPLPDITPTLQDKFSKQSQKQHQVLGYRNTSTPQASTIQTPTETLNRSNSDNSNGSLLNPLQSRTNHSRNRHAGSMISLDSESSTSTSSQGKTPDSNSYNGKDLYSKNNDSRPKQQLRLVPGPISKTSERSVSPNGSYTENNKSQSPSPKESKSEQTSPQKSSNSSFLPDVSNKKESKSKDFLNLFKMKRSNSPKLKKISTNDENLPIIDTKPTTNPTLNNDSSQFQNFQQEFQQQSQLHSSVDTSSQTNIDQNQRQPLSSSGSGFNFNKQTKILQESVKNLPSKNRRKISGKNQISNGDVYTNQTKYETSPTSPTFDQNQLQYPSQAQQQQYQQQSPQQQHHHPQKQKHPKQKTKQKEEPSSQKSHFSSFQQSDTAHQAQAQQQPQNSLSTELQKEQLRRKISMETVSSSDPKQQRPNAPIKFTDSPFGFPLPPLSHSTVIMLDYRFPIHVERAIYRLSHLKLANAKRPLRQQVLLSNFMYAYLNLVNHTLYLQQLEENGGAEDEDQPREDNGEDDYTIQ